MQDDLAALAEKSALARIAELKKQLLDAQNEMAKVLNEKTEMQEKVAAAAVVEDKAGLWWQLVSPPSASVLNSQSQDSHTMTSWLPALQPPEPGAIHPVLQMSSIHLLCRPRSMTIARRSWPRRKRTAPR